MRRVEATVEESFGFLPDSKLSTRQNAQKVLGDTSEAMYFDSSSNLAFHDLTNGAVSRAAKTVLGLSRKFVVTPKEPTSRKRAMEAFEDFAKSICWKVLFARENFEFSRSKLYLKSTRIPRVPPPRIDKRLRKLESELKMLFCNKNKLKAKPNITSFQRTILEKLQETLSVVFANSDKKSWPSCRDTGQIHQGCFEAST